MHYLSLVNRLSEHENGEIRKFFYLLTSYEKFWFFRNRPTIFSTEINGYVALNTLARENPSGIGQNVCEEENIVVEYFATILKRKGRLHYLTLVQSLKSSDSSAKNYFDSHSISELQQFFENRPSEFATTKDGYVTLLGDGAKNECVASFGEEETIVASSGTEDIRGNENKENSSRARISAEEAMVETAIVILLESESGMMDYLALFNFIFDPESHDVPKYFSQMDSNEKYLFFKNRPTTFTIGNGGYVSPGTAILRKIADEIKQSESKIFEYSGFVLKDVSRMYYMNLVKCLKNSDSEVRNYFDLWISADLHFLQFFETRPSVFSIVDGSYICLSNNQKRSDDHERDKTDLEDETEKQIEDAFLSVLFRNRSEEGMRYIDLKIMTLRLYNNVDSVIKTASNEYIFQFCRDRPHYFVIRGNTRVLLNPVFIKIAHFYKGVCSISNIGSGFLDKGGYLSSCRYPECEEHASSQARLVPANVYDQIETQSSVVRISPTVRTLPPKRSVVTDKRFDVRGVAIEASSVQQQRPPQPSNTSSPQKDNFTAKSAVTTSQDKMTTKEGFLKANPGLNLTVSAAHAQSIKNFVSILKTRSTHYQKLLHCACNCDRFTSNFFSYFTLEDVLEFIRMHSMYFSVEDNGTVKLASSSTSADEVFVSEDHVRRVTSAMDSKAVEFFVPILRFMKRAKLGELECCVGFAPGYVQSFFLANFHGRNFHKFFRLRTNNFLVLDKEGSVEFVTGISP